MPPLRLVALAFAACAAVFPAVLAAAPQLPNGSEVVEAIPMAGPFSTLEDYCKSADLDAEHCLAPPTACGAAKGTGKLAGAFTEARVLAGCDVALRAPGGWYVLSTVGLPAWAAFLHNGDRYMSEIASIAPSGDRKSVLVRGTFVHGTDASKMLWLDAPPRDDGWYECEDRLFVCQVGDGGPGCAGPFPVEFTAYCRDREHPERRLHRRDSHDFRFVPQVSGTTLTMASPTAKQPRRAPLPGWAVISIDAPRTVGILRDLSPEHVALRFP